MHGTKGILREDGVMSSSERGRAERSILVQGFRIASLVGLILSLVVSTSLAGAPPPTFVTVITHNVYFGVDLSPVFGSPNPDLALLWKELQDSVIPARAAEIADKIADEQPELLFAESG
jgi:hypothetical protein